MTRAALLQVVACVTLLSAVTRVQCRADGAGYEEEGDGWGVEPRGRDTLPRVMSPARDSYPTGDILATNNINPSHQDRLTTLSKLVHRLQERLAETEDAPSRLEVNRRTAEVKRPIKGRNKRHCWDVADVCCMWNIC